MKCSQRPHICIICIYLLLQIRSDCLTCLRFEAWRQYVVGNTQPMSVRVYDYYEPCELMEHKLYSVTVQFRLVQGVFEIMLTSSSGLQCRKARGSTTCRTYMS